MKSYFLIICYAFLSNIISTYPQETYYRLGSGDSIDNHNRSHCDCFDYYYILESSTYPYDKNPFLENDVSQIYKYFDLRYFNDKTIKILLDSLSSKFILLKVEHNRRDPHYKTYLIERINAYYYYDSTTYLNLTLCLSDNSQFENCGEKENWKKINSIFDYCAYLDKVNISKYIKSKENIYSQVKEKNKKSKKNQIINNSLIEEKELKKKIDEITEKIKKGKIVLPTGNGKQE